MIFFSNLIWGKKKLKRKTQNQFISIVLLKISKMWNATVEPINNVWIHSWNVPEFQRHINQTTKFFAHFAKKNPRAHSTCIQNSNFKIQICFFRYNHVHSQNLLHKHILDNWQATAPIAHIVASRVAFRFLHFPNKTLCHANWLWMQASEWMWCVIKFVTLIFFFCAEERQEKSWFSYSLLDSWAQPLQKFAFATIRMDVFFVHYLFVQVAGIEERQLNRKFATRLAAVQMYASVRLKLYEECLDSNQQVWPRFESFSVRAILMKHIKLSILVDWGLKQNRST